MVLDIRQNLKLGQQLLMTPQLQQAIKLLQLSRLELEQYINEQLLENPALEEGFQESNEEIRQTEILKERTTEEIMSENLASASTMMDSADDKPNEVDWEALARIKENVAPASQKSNNNDETFNYENVVTRGKNLSEYLQDQLAEIDFSDDELKIAEMVIGNINERGYLDMTTEELCKTCHQNLVSVEGVLDTIQRFDPPGIAARNLQECLKNQARHFQIRNPLVHLLLEHHMTDIESGCLQNLKKPLQISDSELTEALGLLADLDPFPGRDFQKDPTLYIIPDVYVFKLSGQWVVSLNDDGLPHLRISEYFDKLNPKNKDDKTFINEKVKSANWLIKSLEQRQQTIFKVATRIVERQEKFFEHGIQFLSPMILKDVADDIEMHESTVSRVTSHKYIHTPRGVFELKYFFGGGTSRTDGTEVASESIREMIRLVIQKENSQKPYSDQWISNHLKEQGLEIARRTVAKYREQLKILPSSKRKKRIF
ncbi:MAG: RNA polymerase factor sigma-54 [Oligoflexales bacterium]